MQLSPSFYETRMQQLIQGLTQATEAFYALSKEGYWREKEYSHTPEFEQARRVMQNLSHLIEYVKR